MDFDKNIIWLPEIDSTNNEATKNAYKSPEGSVWVTHNQTKGRGQQHHSWESESGKNLTFSVLLHPVFLRAEAQFYLSKCISLGISDFLINHGLSASIKWPNDIYIGDKKITGILIENHISGEYISASIAGIGININQEKFLSEAPNPTSVFIETGQVLNLKVCLQEVLRSMEQRYTDLKDQKISVIDEDYLTRLYRFNEWHHYLYDNKKIKAKIIGVQENGELVLTKENGAKITAIFKEISFCL